MYCYINYLYIGIYILVNYLYIGIVSVHNDICTVIKVIYTLVLGFYKHKKSIYLYLQQYM